MNYWTAAWRVPLVLALTLLSACATTSAYEKVSVGQTTDQVVAILGKPSDPGKDLAKLERRRIQWILSKTDNRGAVTFLIWKRSSRLFYLIGFNKKEMVVVKHRLLMED